MTTEEEEPKQDYESERHAGHPQQRRYKHSAFETLTMRFELGFHGTPQFGDEVPTVGCMRMLSKNQAALATRK